MNAEKEKAPLEVQADRLSHLIDSLSGNIAKLESKLAPVMMNLPENPNKESCPVELARSPFVEFLKSECGDLDRAIRSIEKMLARLEV